MALPASSVSIACTSIAKYLTGVLRTRGYSVTVMVGTPTAANPSKTDTKHRLNLFFYRFEPTDFDADVSSKEMLMLRGSCMLTAFSLDEDGVEAGENDLRVLGEVVRIFHETPVLGPIKVENITIRTQMVFTPLSLNDINQLWSLQRDVAYRPSLAYEVFLIPVLPVQRELGAPLVSSIGLELSVDPREPREKLIATAPFVPEEIDTTKEDWAPQLAFLHQGVLAQNITLPKTASVALPPFFVAGKIGQSVTLKWDIWNSALGWKTSAVIRSANITVNDLSPMPLATLAVRMPFPTEPGVTQAVLYATRTYLRASDGASVELRSDPLLVTLLSGVS